MDDHLLDVRFAVFTDEKHALRVLAEFCVGLDEVHRSGHSLGGESSELFTLHVIHAKVALCFGSVKTDFCNTFIGQYLAQSAELDPVDVRVIGGNFELEHMLASL